MFFIHNEFSRDGFSSQRPSSLAGMERSGIPVQWSAFLCHDSCNPFPVNVPQANIK